MLLFKDWRGGAEWTTWGWKASLGVSQNTFPGLHNHCPSQWVQSRLLSPVIQSLAWANNVLYFNEVLWVQSRPIDIWKHARQLKKKKTHPNWEFTLSYLNDFGQWKSISNRIKSLHSEYRVQPHSVRLYKLKFWPAGGATWKVQNHQSYFSSSSGGTCIYVPNVMVIYPILVETFHTKPQRWTLLWH